MIAWAREVSRKLGFVTVVYRSDYGPRSSFLTLACERSEVYKHADRPRKVIGQLVTGTKKIDCPFRLRGRPVGASGWRLIAKCGQHNLKRAETLVGHPYPGRLKPEEKRLVANMTKNRVRPG